MSTMMTETPEALPAEERRGGEEGIDWDKVRPGEEFPPREADERFELENDSDAAPLYAWCGTPGCGGT